MRLGLSVYLLHHISLLWYFIFLRLFSVPLFEFLLAQHALLMVVVYIGNSIFGIDGWFIDSQTRGFNLGYVWISGFSSNVMIFMFLQGCELIGFGATYVLILCGGKSICKKIVFFVTFIF